MFPYWILFGSFGFATLLGNRNRQQKVSVILVAAAVLVVLMMGLRYQVGGDWITYRLVFNEVSARGLISSLEVGVTDPGYVTLNWLVQGIGIDIWLVNVVCAAALVWGVLTLAVRQPNPWLVFLIAIPYLIIVVGMGYTRQAAAIGLSMVALFAFLDRRWGKMIIALIVATLFHKSAVILVPIVGLSYSRSRVMTLFMFALLAAILYQLFVSSDIEQLSKNYIGGHVQSQGAGIRVAMNSLAALIFLLAQRRFRFREDERVMWRNIAIAAMMGLPALYFSEATTVVDRLSLYFIPLQLVILGRMPWAFGGKQTPPALTIAGIIAYSATVQFVWLNYANNSYWWLPYRTVLSDVPEVKVGRPDADE